MLKLKLLFFNKIIKFYSFNDLLVVNLVANRVALHLSGLKFLNT